MSHCQGNNNMGKKDLEEDKKIKTKCTNAPLRSCWISTCLVSCSVWLLCMPVVLTN
ncbi:hypothetical protein IF1G_03268 [Cordyceps javanica]|uniref:Uncharacterized protein n=1 Tax=Cordyceps javanica TaxID=43265 RepID=A0A545V763_9HYPO|nr:hypothetical protein IF1G_03268 [Cordyceps javanica]